MSVPKPNRESGELEINTLALQLCLHTLKITENEKIYTPNHKDVVTMARRLAIDIDRLCWRANNVKVGQSKKLYSERLELQRAAGDKCNDLNRLIRICKPLFHLPGKKAMYWSKLTVELRNKIRSWYQSDEARLKP